MPRVIVAAAAIVVALVWVLGPGAGWVLEHFDGVTGLTGGREVLMLCVGGVPMRDARTESAAVGAGASPSLRIAVGLAAVPAAVNGFGRFGYGLILPAMQHALTWSPLTAGLVGAANTAGYLIGAIAADRVLLRIGERAAVLVSLLVSTIAVVGCAISASLPVLLALRLIAGGTAAVAFIAGAVLLTRLVGETPARLAGRLLGVYFAGPGVGIAVSAPLITPLATAGRWRACWVLLGLACGVCTVVTVLVLRRLDAVAVSPTIRRDRRPWHRRQVAALLISYALFGAGYIAFMTFVVAYLHTDRHTTTGQITLFWLTLGTAGLAIGSTIMAPLSRLRAGHGMAIVVGITAIASGLPLLSSSGPAVLTAAALFGTFFSVSAAATEGVRQRLPPGEWPAAIAGLTAGFGMGQCLGPILSGALSNGPYGFRAGLFIGTTLLVLSAVSALFQTAQRSKEEHAGP
jgi:predicted MFS family arabinose efflux permease